LGLVDQLVNWSTGNGGIRFTFNFFNNNINWWWWWSRNAPDGSPSIIGLVVQEVVETRWILVQEIHLL
jgi:hypothetical protein